MTFNCECSKEQYDKNREYIRLRKEIKDLEDTKSRLRDLLSKEIAIFTNQKIKLSNIGRQLDGVRQCIFDTEMELMGL